jgi:hypothetical protein
MPADKARVPTIRVTCFQDRGPRNFDLWDATFRTGRLQALRSSPHDPVACHSESPKRGSRRSGEGVARK